MVSDLAVGPRSKSHFISSVNAREVAPVLRGPHVTHAFLSKSTRPNAAEPRLARDRYTIELIRSCQATGATSPSALDPADRTAPIIWTGPAARKSLHQLPRNEHTAPCEPDSGQGLEGALCRHFKACMLNLRTNNPRKASFEDRTLLRRRAAGPAIRRNGARDRLAGSRSPGAWP